MASAAEEFAAWARQHAAVLARGDDIRPPDEPVDDSDLAPLAAMVGKARIVAIGETFHHTHELLALRERLVRFLVERLGFRTIVLEVVRPGPNAIDDFVLDGRGTAEAALIAAGVRMWRNRETARIVDWAATFNRQQIGAPLRIAGMDILAPGASMRAVLEHIEVESAARVIELSYSFDVDGREDQIVYNAVAATDRTLLRESFRHVLETLAIDREAHHQRLGVSVYNTLFEHSVVVLQALRMLEVGTAGWALSLARRDEALAENVGRLVAADPDARLIVLSHNAHINAAGPSPALGIFLRQRFGDSYLAIGTTYGAARFDPPIYGVNVAPGDDRDSIDQLVGEDSPLLLDLRRRGNDWPDYLAGPARMQATGTGAASHVLYDSIAAAFDVLAYVPKISNARQLIETELSLDVAAIDAGRR